MDAARLLSVIVEIEAAYQAGQLKLFQALIQQYTASRDAPAQDNTLAINKARSALVNFVEDSSFENYPPSKAAILHAINGTDAVGPGFLRRLNEILSLPGQTTSGLVAGLIKFQTELERFRAALAQSREGLQSLGIEPYSIPESQFEVGVLIPGKLVDYRLGELVGQLGQWNQILRAFQEVAGDEKREVTVSSLATGSYLAFLPVAYVAANLFSKTVDKVLDWYTRILEIRKRRLELQELGAPIAETNTIKKHEREELEKWIRSLAEELVKASPPKVDTTRKRELENQLTISIRQIVRFVDKGGTVEVDSEPPAAPEEPEEPEVSDEGTEPTAEETKARELRAKEFNRLKSAFDDVSAVRDRGASLRKLPARPEPILQLSDGAPEDDSAESEKASKKKS